MPELQQSLTASSDLAELAVVRRSGFIESRHFGSLSAINAGGEPVLELGTPECVILPRSTVKPLQALACLVVGAPLSGAELAIAAGSHTGQDEHVRVVNAILDRAGLSQDALGCPVDRPEDEHTFETMVRTGEARSTARMNCSGKHAAMLLACAVNGWSTHDYLAAEHPLQQYIKQVMAEQTGVAVTHIAVDGCGAPLFGTTVRGVATAFRNLVTAAPDSPAGLVADAMRSHPFYVGGEGQANTELMRSLPGVLAKGGAEGVIGVAAPDGSALSMKIIDGNPRATTLIALHVLEYLGTSIDAARELIDIPVLGGGARVGELDAGRDLAMAIAAGGRA